MIVNNKQVLTNFGKEYPDSEKALSAWLAEIELSDWQTPNQLKEKYGNASIFKKRNVVFNICGNKYRLWVKINYQHQIVFIKELGTHKEYDDWEIES